ncbi:Hypothetical predicted protein [Pelobates cultripes]|uniref:Secreted protein n=1 Tax=Pelobates cultripes TaxID=61616 RepID=A0AAD1T5Q7_PELCU|nr:Hypothetical predicted protein [Pelobates cultripes]
MRALCTLSLFESVSLLSPSLPLSLSLSLVEPYLTIKINSKLGEILEDPRGSLVNRSKENAKGPTFGQFPRPCFGSHLLGLCRLLSSSLSPEASYTLSSSPKHYHLSLPPFFSPQLHLCVSFYCPFKKKSDHSVLQSSTTPRPLLGHLWSIKLTVLLSRTGWGTGRTGDPLDLRIGSP